MLLHGNLVSTARAVWQPGFRPQIGEEEDASISKDSGEQIAISQLYTWYILICSPDLSPRHRRKAKRKESFNGTVTRAVSTKEHSTKRATIKEHSNNGSTDKQSDSKVPKTGEPSLENLGPNGQTPNILATEWPAPSKEPRRHKRYLCRQ